MKYMHAAFERKLLKLTYAQIYITLNRKKYKSLFITAQSQFLNYIFRRVAFKIASQLRCLLHYNIILCLYLLRFRH